MLGSPPDAVFQGQYSDMHSSINYQNEVIIVSHCLWLIFLNEINSSHQGSAYFCFIPQIAATVLHPLVKVRFLNDSIKVIIKMHLLEPSDSAYCQRLHPWSLSTWAPIRRANPIWIHGQGITLLSLTWWNQQQYYDLKLLHSWITACPASPGTLNPKIIFWFHCQINEA